MYMNYYEHIMGQLLMSVELLKNIKEKNEQLTDELNNINKLIDLYTGLCAYIPEVRIMEYNNGFFDQEFNYDLKEYIRFLQNSFRVFTNEDEQHSEFMSYIEKIIFNVDTEGEERNKLLSASCRIMVPYSQSY